MTIIEETPRYHLVRHMGQRCLLCRRCNRITFNPNDIAQRYCGFCHVFLDEQAVAYAERVEEEGA